MSQIQRYVFSLGANEEINPAIPKSTFIGCTSSSDIFTCYPSDLSPIVLQSGLSVEFEKTFNSVRLKNGDVPQTIELYIGAGRLNDRRLSVSGGIPMAGNAGAVSGAVSVGSTAKSIRSANTNRSSCLVQNLGGSDLWVGTDSSVTSANGIKIGVGGSATFTFQGAIWGISSSAVDVRFLEETA